MSNFKIAVFGATSHIAKGLINNFLQAGDVNLHLYTRSFAKVLVFLDSIKQAPSSNCVVHEGYTDFIECNYDVVINCVGAGPPNKLKNDFSLWFSITEEYDNMIIKSLHKKPQTLYVNFSSGAVYGKNATMPAEEYTTNTFQVNKISTDDYYSIARLNSEAKHRSFHKLKILDLRIFSYFSRFIDLNSGYFMTDVLKALINKEILQTNDINIIRDYVHPDDLFSLILKCIGMNGINIALDVASKEPVDKAQVLDFFSKEYNLKYTTLKSLTLNSPNGSKNVYCSNYNMPLEIRHESKYTSMDTVAMEAKQILKQAK